MNCIYERLFWLMYLLRTCKNSFKDVNWWWEVLGMWRWRCRHARGLWWARRLIIWQVHRLWWVHLLHTRQVAHLLLHNRRLRVRVLLVFLVLVLQVQNENEFKIDFTIHSYLSHEAERSRFANRFCSKLCDWGIDHVVLIGIRCYCFYSIDHKRKQCLMTDWSKSIIISKKFWFN